ncbi:MAG: glutamyl-tRNA reductase [Proteobacteria bacterium]|nr:glutamyl-tRNA reductase [Pseudomonadota bacterium]
MNIVVVGLSHKTAPVEVREKISFSSDKLPEALKTITSTSGISEGVILSTCNRVEVIAITSHIHEGIENLKKFMADFNNIPPKSIENHLYSHTSEEAIRHIFRVGSSLDSMVVGEPQILGQMKEAYQQALDHDFTGIILNKLYRKAFSVAKRVRTETNIASSAVSISYAAVELAKKIFGHLNDKRVMLIGAGEMCELAARHFINNGIKEILVANRTHERAVNLAAEINGRSVLFENIYLDLDEVDIILSSTGSPNYIINAEQVKEALTKRRNKPMFFIDIAVPRDMDPRINDIDNAYLYDIDDIQGVVDANKKEREKEAAAASLIIESEITQFHKWLKTLDVTPTIVSLREKLEQIRFCELEKLSAINNLSSVQMSAIEKATASMINKILHIPISNLKKMADTAEGDLYVDAVRKLYDID